MAEYPNDKIVTVDDDMLYAPDMLYKLYNTAKRYPNDIICHRTTKFNFIDGQWHATAAKTWSGASYLNKLTGVAGTLYQPHILHPDVMNMDLALQLCPTNDDQWFWIQAIRNNAKIRAVNDGNPPLIYVPDTQECGLCVQNDGAAGLFWLDFDRLMHFYPDIDSLLRQEATNANKKQNLYHKERLANGRRHIYFCGIKVFSYRQHNKKSTHKKNIPYDVSVRYCSENRLPIFLRDKFLALTGKLPTEELTRFRDKIIWSYMFDVTPLKIQCTDKLLVRDYVKKVIGDKYLPKLYAVYTRPDDFDIKSLPDSFMLTFNAGSGQNKIVTDKSQINQTEIRSLIRSWLTYNHSELACEMQYRYIPPRVIARELVNIRPDIEYKLWCFGGRVEFIVLNSYSDGHNNIRVKTKTRDWQDAGFYQCGMGVVGEIEQEFKKPDFLDELIKIAEKLAAPFDFVRVDFYETKSGELVFGELTFSPTAGFLYYKPNDPAIQIRLGQLYKLPPRDEFGFAVRK